jgi:long-chain acyl-CoA synthetase
MTNLSHNLAESAAIYPNRPAVRMDDEVLTYSALDRLASQLVTLLHDRGVGPGDRVGLMLPNVAQFPIAYYGILRAGAVVVPMNPLLKEREMEYYLDDSGAKLLLAWPDAIAEAAAGAKAAGVDLLTVVPGEFEATLAAQEPTSDPVSRASDDTAVVLYTSGTTGKPKGAELTHGGLNRNQAVMARTLMEIGPDDVVMGCLPLFHVFGMGCGMNSAISSGSLLTLIPRFTPGKALEVIQRDQVTVFQGVPTMYAAMLGAPQREKYDVSTVRCCVSGGAALPVEVLRSFEEAFGCIILEGYGLSESSPVAAFNHPHAGRKPGSIGTPIEGVRMRLVDENRLVVAAGEIGEIEICGHNVMKGYWNKPDATAVAIDADGWLSTGDMARQDGEGYYFIVDRKKDLLIRGGYNVYPREVEEVLYEHPAVAEAAVVGIPHALLGEEIGAAVQLKAGQTATTEELRDHVKQRIAAYKYPRVVWIVDELPKGPTGKILRREIEIPEGILA